MVRKRRLLTISVILIITFFISTNYLLTILTTSQTEVQTIHDKIYQQLKELPEEYKTRRPLKNDNFDNFLKFVNKASPREDVATVWQTANSWVSKDHLVNLNDPIVGDLLLALKSSKIISSDLDTRGTQLKLLLTLQGNQNVVFKPKWYTIDRVIEGPVYAGKDRYNSEIIAFYLSAILNMPLTPCSVERVVSFSNDIMPVATKRLINTSFEISNRTCIFGKCYYCKKQDAICEDEEFKVYGSVIFNINASFKSYRSPWQRTYKKNKKAVWETNDSYCKNVKEKLARRRLLDLVDVSIFDFLIQNGDRHHYETLYDNVVLIDNGKGFGNPNLSHLDVLAPLYQCCILRNVTLQKLLNVAGGYLLKRLEAIPNIENLLTIAHRKAIEERLLIVFATIEYCNNENKKQ